MEILYKKIAEVEVRHDYYLLWRGENPVTFFWPDNYSILNDLDFIPSQRCVQTLRDHRIIFRKIPTGFVLLARVLPAQTAQGQFRTLSFIETDLKLDFYIKINNRFFHNFTNLPFVNNQPQLYYFNNQPSGNSLPQHLSIAHPILNGGEVNLNLGDIVEHNNELYELSKNITIAPGFVPNNEVKIGPNTTRYVGRKDQWNWQYPNYQYVDSNNANPGELVQFTLKDLNGTAVHPGNTPGTGQSQLQYFAPRKGHQPLSHRIDLSGLQAGPYTMTIQRISGNQTEQFYLLDPLVQPQVFGVIELFASANGVEFITYDHAKTESIIQAQTYELRFKNRSTRWQYFDKAGAPLITPGQEQLIPLTQKQRAFELNSNVLPDPDPAMIYPTLNQTTGSVEHIFSKTYLNQ
ncbi:MAG: hypothetical protein AAGD05_02990 [Bacteroidota bacterium]